MFGLLINTIFNINLINAPTARAIAGVLVLFNPYSPPLIVWLNAINIIEIEYSIKIFAPSEAVG